MITTIVFTKDRPAQLDLLLRSIERNGGGHFSPILVNDKDAGPAFEKQTQFFLDTAGEYICFMCDDGIFYRSWNGYRNPQAVLLSKEALCFSLRLGGNTTVCYPSGVKQSLPMMENWFWINQPRQPGMSDFGYPGSIDGHVFRTGDILRMLENKPYPDPTMLELCLVAGCNELADERPVMACFPHSVYVGNPVNRVSAQSNVRYGTRYPITAAECNERFLRGERIDLDALDFSGVNGAHTEIELKWKQPSP